MRLRPSSVRVRLTLWYTVILAGIVLALFLAVYFFVKTSLIRQLDRQVESEFQTVSQSLAEEPNELSEFETEGVRPDLPGPEGERRPLRDPGVQTSGLRVADPATPAAGRTVKSPAGTMFRLKTGPAGPDLALAVAVTEEPVRRVLRTLLIIFILALPVGLVLAAFGVRSWPDGSSGRST